MLDYIYPEEEQRFFTNREHTLAVLGLSRDLLAQGVRKHLALSGFRRVGKTVVLKEFLRRSLQPGSADDCRLVYMDLPRLAFTPEAFADQHLLLELAFNAPEMYAQASGQRVMLILDEFPEILALNNYPQIRDVLALFRAVLQGQSRVVYVVAGSMIGLMERIFLDAASPLFVHFQLEAIGPFGREDCDALARKRFSMLADPVPVDVLAAVDQVTRGH